MKSNQWRVVSRNNSMVQPGHTLVRSASHGNGDYIIGTVDSLDDANKIVKTVNLYEAHCAVAEATENHQNSKRGEEMKNWTTLQNALADLKKG